MRRPRSLQATVPLVGTAVLAVSLVVLAVLALTFMQAYGERELDRTLAREQERFAQSVASFAADELANAPSTASEPDAAVAAAVRRYLQLNPPSESYAAFVELPDGRRLSTTATTPLLTPLQDASTLPVAPTGRIGTIDTPAGPARATAVPVALGGETVATLHLYAPLQPLRDQLWDTAAFLAVAAGGSLVVGAALLVGLLGRALRPLRALVRSARATDLGDLTVRVPVPTTGDEVATLAVEFNTMLDRLDQAYRQQQWLVASISHELRTPVTIARGHLELLTSLLPAGDATATADVLRDELIRLGAMVDDLLAIARAESGDFLRVRTVDLVAWFEELELKLTGHPVRDRLRITPPPPVTLDADAERLTQAVVNLVTNAYRHTPPSSRITVRAHLDGSDVVVTVVDDGGGIPAEVQARLFEPFVRSGDAEGSTGLGLSVVKAIVDAHGGAIDVDTSATGTTVAIRLPCGAEPPHGEVRVLPRE